jgi:TusE/DsrC/DsvC family sulfur relay protein
LFEFCYEVIAVMPRIDVNGKAVELNEEGFLSHPEEWDRAIAEALAKSEHWSVIEFIRNYYLEKNLAPMVRKVCQASGFSLKHIYELFPSGPAKGACKVAGLPKPDGCV